MHCSSLFKVFMRFTTSIKDYTNFRTIYLIDELLKTKVEILTTGAILNSFFVKNENHFMNIIDGFELENFETQLISNSFKSAKLCPFVGRLESSTFNFGQEEYSIQKFQLNNLPIHGLLFDSNFDIVEINSNNEKAEVKLITQYYKANDGFPFKFTCIITYSLLENNKLVIHTEIKNDDIKLLPLTDGWHHYFSFGKNINSLLLEFQSKNLFELNELLLPTGKKKKFEEFGSLKKIEHTRFDDCFELNFAECQPLCVLRDTEKRIQIEIHPSESYPYLQIFTPDHRNSIALEVMSSLPNAFNNGIGLKVLEPQESVIFTTQFSINTF